MDYRCPVCKGSLARRKLSHAVVARMEIDCTHCKSKIRLNVHRVESIIILMIFGTIVLFGASTYWFQGQSQSLVLFALGAAMAGTIVLALLEHTYLRSWPRYALIVQKPDSQVPRPGA